MPLKILLSRRAEDFLSLLSQTNEKLYRILSSQIDKLSETYRHDPFLKGFEFKGMRRRRVGDYRILYRVDHGELIILVVDIGHRRDVYPVPRTAPVVKAEMGAIFPKDFSPSHA